MPKLSVRKSTVRHASSIDRSVLAVWLILAGALSVPHFTLSIRIHFLLALSTLNIQTPLLLIVLVLPFEQVHLTTCWCVWKGCRVLQTVKTLIRRCILMRLMWICSFCSSIFVQRPSANGSHVEGFKAETALSIRCATTALRYRFRFFLHVNKPRHTIFIASLLWGLK